MGRIRRNRTIARSLLSGCATLTAIGLAGLAEARAAEPIKIGVIGEESSVAGASLTKAAQMAADDINAKGGIDGRKIELAVYDDHSSAADAVRAFQRAAKQDKVSAILATYISEVALAIEPWSARLHMPLITVGAASTDITKHVHDDYAHYKYTFQGWLNSAFIAQSICDAEHDMLVEPYHLKTTVVMSEDAAWTKPLDERYLECLPKAGLKVLDHIRFNPDTTDFTPIYNKIESEHPDVITAGISHVGVQPTVQWHDQQVPIAMAGQSSQATTSTFWKDTNGATEGVITATAAGPGVAITPKTIPFIEAYQKAYKVDRMPSAVSAAQGYDSILLLAAAIKQAGTTDGDKVRAALENLNTKVEGVVTTYDKPFTHDDHEAIKAGMVVMGEVKNGRVILGK